jgi:hypothetical protein
MTVIYWNGYLSVLFDSIFHFTRYRTQFKELEGHGFGSAKEIRNKISKIGFKETGTLEFAGETYNVTNFKNKATFELTVECAKKYPEFEQWERAVELANTFQNPKKRDSNTELQIIEIIKEIGPNALRGNWRSIVGPRKRLSAQISN